MLYSYFKLQFRLLVRHIQKTGLHPLIAFIIVAIFFYFLNYSLHNKGNENLKYLLVFLPLMIMMRLNSKKRNDFLKATFSKSAFLKIRILENELVAVPFLIILLIGQYYIWTFFLGVFSVFLVFFQFQKSFSIVIPNPFFKSSFEFIEGYRALFPLAFLLHLLGFIAIWVGNINLGIFAFLLNGFLPIGFFTKLEPVFFIWNYSMNSKEFLNNKLKVTIRDGILWNLLLLIVLAVFFYKSSFIFLGIFIYLLLGYCAALLCKYAQFPRSQNFLFALKLAFSLLLFPVMILVIPHFYRLAKKELQNILS